MSEQLIVKPPRPNGGGWVQWPWIRPVGQTAVPYAIERWYNRGQEVQVLSAIELVLPEGAKEGRPEYHISVSGLVYGGSAIHRVSESRARCVLAQFGLDGWLEDNHVPGGIVRNYWRPVAEPQVGEVCACVAEEPAMREMKGDYIWRGAKR